MKTPASRRRFLERSTKACLVCGALSLRFRSPLHGQMAETPVKPDPKKLNYCGYVCPDDCPMKLAGLSGDVEKKHEAYEMWRLKERYDLEFDPDEIFCNGCKTDQEKLGAAVSHCPVRACAIEKGYDCCIECDELADCELPIWASFPDFHKQVISMQAEYRGT